jgi:hypothetical protein
MHPRWFQLIHFFCRARGFETLTFPFVIGALRDPVGLVIPAENSRRELRQLLQQMVDETPGSYVLWIYRCGQLKQPVIRPRSEDRSYGIPVHSSVQLRDTLFVSSEFFSGKAQAQSLDSLRDRLWEEFGGDVSDGKFSVPEHRRTYCSFSDDDLAAIEESRRHEFEGVA